VKAMEIDKKGGFELCFLFLKTFFKGKNDYMKDKLRCKRKRKTQRVYILVHSLTRVTSTPLTLESLSTKFTKIKVA
jgi:hypothetical protein